MGKKYASLQVRLEDIGAEAVRAAYDGIMDAYYPTDVETVAGRLGLKIDPKQLPFANSLIKMGIAEMKKYKTVIRDGFVSIYDKRLTCETVDSVAKKLSSAINAEVLPGPAFDDDDVDE